MLVNLKVLTKLVKNLKTPDILNNIYFKNYEMIVDRSSCKFFIKFIFIKLKHKL